MEENVVILASASPRRRELLQQVGIVPLIIPSQVEEIITGTDPEQIVMELSRQKAMDVAAGYKGTSRIVIGADTVVSVEGEILGKPRDRQDAIRMLSLISGRAHQVYTGVTLIPCSTGAAVTFADKTEVQVYPMTRKQMEQYADTKAPMDKAGAYGIQGLFAAYIRGICGDYNNVVGLPVGKLCRELEKINAL